MFETIIQSSSLRVLTNSVENVHLVFAMVDFKPCFLQSLVADASYLSASDASCNFKPPAIVCLFSPTVF